MSKDETKLERHRRCIDGLSDPQTKNHKAIEFLSDFLATCRTDEGTGSACPKMWMRGEKLCDGCFMGQDLYEHDVTTRACWKALAFGEEPNPDGINDQLGIVPNVRFECPACGHHTVAINEKGTHLHCSNCQESFSWDNKPVEVELRLFFTEDEDDTFKAYDQFSDDLDKDPRELTEH